MCAYGVFLLFNFFFLILVGLIPLGCVCDGARWSPSCSGLGRVVDLPGIRDTDSKDLKPLKDVDGLVGVCLRG